MPIHLPKLPTLPKLPNTASRVTQNTSRHLNEQIRRITEENLNRYNGADQETIAKRLDELDREWDFERAMETGASLQVILGLVLGTFVHRRWYAWSGLVAGFILLHAIQGWAPVLPFMRRRGFRTEAEIEEERDALRILRGDFHPTTDPREALAEVRLSSGPTIAGASTTDSK